MLKGVDISRYQKDVDFNKLKSEIDFVMIRSTCGDGYSDPYFEKNRDGARLAGLCIGFYHYCYPQLNAPEEEADWFTTVVSCRPGEILALDFEENFPTPVDWCKRFLDKATSNMGFKPIIYLNQYLTKTYDWTPVINAGYGLWLAKWDYNPDSANWDSPWPFVAMRQYSNQGNVAGITPIDLDVFYGDETSFKKYGNPPPPEEPIVSCYNCIALQTEIDLLKKYQTEAITKAVSTAISENDAKWQSKMDTANQTISQLQSNIAESTKLSTLLELLWKKITGR